MQRCIPRDLRGGRRTATLRRKDYLQGGESMLNVHLTQVNSILVRLVEVKPCWTMGQYSKMEVEKDKMDKAKILRD